MDVVLAGSEAAVVMVEGGAHEAPEEALLEALLFGHQAIQPIIRLQADLPGRWAWPSRPSWRPRWTQP